MTYKQLLTNVVKSANIEPMQTLKRIAQDKSLSKVDWNERKFLNKEIK